MPKCFSYVMFLSDNIMEPKNMFYKLELTWFLAKTTQMRNKSYTCELHGLAISVCMCVCIDDAKIVNSCGRLGGFGITCKTRRK